METKNHLTQNEVKQWCCNVESLESKTFFFPYLPLRNMSQRAALICSEHHRPCNLEKLSQTRTWKSWKYKQSQECRRCELLPGIGGDIWLCWNEKLLLPLVLSCRFSGKALDYKYELPSRLFAGSGLEEHPRSVAAVGCFWWSAHTTCFTGHSWNLRCLFDPSWNVKILNYGVNVNFQLGHVYQRIPDRFGRHFFSS